MAIENESTTKIVLLCEPNTQHSCPELLLGDLMVYIKDDYGNKVKLTRAQWDFLCQKIQKKEL